MLHSPPALPPRRKILLDVHPSNEPIHGWRSFLLHIAAITIGLLLALGLGAAAVYLQHRHLVSQARENIRREIAENQKLLPQNLAHLREDADRMKANIVVIRQLRDHPRSPHGQLSFNLDWSPFASSAFSTARATGALTYMRYDRLQHLSQIYAQQDYINGLGQTLFTDQGKAPGIIASEVHIEDLQLEQLAQLMSRTADLLSEIDDLERRLGQLQQQYDSAANLETR